MFVCDDEKRDNSTVLLDYLNVFSDPVCEKESYSLFNCMYVATYNSTCERAITLKFDFCIPPIIALWHDVI